MSAAASLLLRAGVAFAFAFPAIDEIGSPDSWIGYFPPFLAHAGIPQPLLLHGFGLVEIAIALWLLSGWRAYVPAAIAAAMLVAIVVFNMPQLEILFRDLSIAAAALALAADSWAGRKGGASSASV